VFSAKFSRIGDLLPNFTIVKGVFSPEFSRRGKKLFAHFNRNRTFLPDTNSSIGRFSAIYWKNMIANYNIINRIYLTKA